MTIEQIKAEAKKRFGKDLTNEEAQALLEKGGKLTDEELGTVSGGNPSWRFTQRPSDFDWKNW